MADTEDKAEAPSGATGETTATGAASTQDDPKIALEQARAEAAAARAEAAAARTQAEGAARLAHKRDNEIAELRRRVSQDTGTEEAQADPNADIRARQDLIDFKLEHPDWQKVWPSMVEVARDPNFAMLHQHAPESRATLEAAYREVQNRALQKELETVRADKEKLNQAKEQASNQAFVSGQGASAGQVTISEKELAGMTAKQMEEKFGREVLLKGLM